jgi:DNA replication protein DnaC
MEHSADIRVDPPVVFTKLDAKLARCPQHGDYESEGVRLSRGREVWKPCPGCSADQKLAEEDRRREERAARARAEYEQKVGAAAIPPRFIGKTLESFRADSEAHRVVLSVARDYIDNFEQYRKTGQGLILAGMPGTGKSHIGAAILQAILPVHVGQYVTCLQMIRLVRESWRKDSERSERKVIDMIGQVPLLVVDEIGVQYGTEGEQTVIFDILDKRYRDLMPSVLLTNQDTAGFKSFIGERAFDRLTETCRWVAFDWPSYRAQARREAFSRG